MNEASQVPLIELLRNVSASARYTQADVIGYGTTFYFVGRMCHEAADALAAKDAEITRLGKINSDLSATHNRSVVREARQTEEIERLRVDAARWREHVEHARLADECELRLEGGNDAATKGTT